MFFSRRFLLSSFIVLVIFLTPAQADINGLVKAMTEHLACYPLDLITMESQEPSINREDVCLATIYHEIGATPLWVTPDGPGEKAQILLRYLQESADEGLQPEKYQVEKIESLWAEREYAKLARLDTLLTYNIVKYVHDVSHGQIKPFMVDPELFAEAGDRGFDPVLTVEKLLATVDLDGFLAALPPANIHYQGLKKGLAEYRRIRSEALWLPLQAGKSIRHGESDERIPLVRQRLAILLGKEDVPAASDSESQVYDDSLREDVIVFQLRHGLKTDGIIGKNTLTELNVSPAERVDQIVINMARWRWQDHDLGDEYILVNIAGYKLDAYRGGELALTLPVIVGKFQHQTPVFSDVIKYIEINPFWNVPPSIAMKEELPKLRENPFYLVEKNMCLFSSWQADAVELDSTAIDWSQISRSQMARYKLRQDPGPFNALGKVKFVFPNHYSVYLHDTPTKNLFSEHYRSFSHGCIRVSTPEKLAQFVLSGEEEDWQEEDIAEMFADQRRKVVRINRKLPIHLTYQTAWLDKSGRIHFNRDVYARDNKLFTALLAK